MRDTHANTKRRNFSKFPLFLIYYIKIVRDGVEKKYKKKKKNLKKGNSKKKKKVYEKMPIDFYYLEYSGPTVSVGFIAGKSDRRSFELENELSLL